MVIIDSLEGVGRNLQELGKIVDGFKIEYIHNANQAGESFARLMDSIEKNYADLQESLQQLNKVLNSISVPDEIVTSISSVYKTINSINEIDLNSEFFNKANDSFIETIENTEETSIGEITDEEHEEINSALTESGITQEFQGFNLNKFLQLINLSKSPTVRTIGIGVAIEVISYFAIQLLIGGAQIETMPVIFLVCYMVTQSDHSNN